MTLDPASCARARWSAQPYRPHGVWRRGCQDRRSRSLMDVLHHPGMNHRVEISERAGRVLLCHAERLLPLAAGREKSAEESPGADWRKLIQVAGEFHPGIIHLLIGAKLEKGQGGLLRLFELIGEHGRVILRQGQRLLLLALLL